MTLFVQMEIRMLHNSSKLLVTVQCYIEQDSIFFPLRSVDTEHEVNSGLTNFLVKLIFCVNIIFSAGTERLN